MDDIGVIFLQNSSVPRMSRLPQSSLWVKSFLDEVERWLVKTVAVSSAERPSLVQTRLYRGLIGIGRVDWKLNLNDKCHLRNEMKWYVHVYSVCGCALGGVNWTCFDFQPFNNSQDRKFLCLVAFPSFLFQFFFKDILSLSPALMLTAFIF